MNGGDTKKQPASGQGNAGWQYKPEAPSSPPAYDTSAPATDPSQEEIVWSASEFVSHDKGIGWYSLLALAAAALAGAVYFLTQDLVSVCIIIVVALLLGIAAIRKPRVLNYQVNGSGLTIGQKFYGYQEFKSFSIMEEGAFSSIMFLPLRRFMPSISIYYDPEDEAQIVTVLSHYLPMEARSHDVIDNLIRRIRF
ncbi:MAG: hypothetical protein AAB834_01875 [Patescibacteria group bacterium]